MADDDGKMDKRCPRGLKCLPNEFCPLAVLRLRAIRTAGKELTEEEESKLPGCPWSVNHQMANYCFFSYIQNYSGDKSPSDVEVASLNCLSVEAVKKTEKVALNKIREAEQFKSLKRDLNGESVIDDKPSDEDYTVYR
jgi:hypothetical protein